jgi:hypothetical protein
MLKPPACHHSRRAKPFVFLSIITQDKKPKLIQVYIHICNLYDSELKYYSQRYSNNSNPAFTDQEIMTIYLFVGNCQKYFLIKDIHTFYNSGGRYELAYARFIH